MYRSNEKPSIKLPKEFWRLEHIAAARQYDAHERRLTEIAEQDLDDAQRSRRAEELRSVAGSGSIHPAEQHRLGGSRVKPDMTKDQVERSRRRAARLMRQPEVEATPVAGDSNEPKAGDIVTCLACRKQYRRVVRERGVCGRLYMGGTGDVESPVKSVFRLYGSAHWSAWRVEPVSVAAAISSSVADDRDSDLYTSKVKRTYESTRA